ncbi:MAG: hypothetical protein EPO55_17670 [Reyranella sp.]|uniref:hypothetical protein n=1 Tax=Reyranella sp. TaxID=1929291 RepID=UPI0012104BFB|nr:hypothetical protein [Reyranella sp.]TAJ37789.1 MAG: hypothetical protein EPO55_17670 [Reyranella sp.]
MSGLVFNLAAMLLAALALWSIRHELTEKATMPLAWTITPALAIVVAAILLIVSPGKRFELWVLAIVIGLGLGALMGLTLKLNRDFGLGLIRVPRTWDGAAAAALLLLLALARLVTSNLMNRQSGKFGVLGAAAAFLAAYLVARYIVARFYKSPRAIHLDMRLGENPQRTLVN